MLNAEEGMDMSHDGKQQTPLFKWFTREKLNFLLKIIVRIEIEFLPVFETFVNSCLQKEAGDKIDTQRLVNFDGGAGLIEANIR